jgi:hypothetical protein
MDETVRWTNLRPWEIAKRLAEKYEIKVSRTVIGKLLKKHDYRRRQALKKQTMKNVAHRNEQFENIARLIADYEMTENPIMSMDTKKKEYFEVKKNRCSMLGYEQTTSSLSTYDRFTATRAIPGMGRDRRGSQSL